MRRLWSGCGYFVGLGCSGSTGVTLRVWISWLPLVLLYWVAVALMCLVVSRQVALRSCFESGSLFRQKPFVASAAARGFVLRVISDTSLALDPDLKKPPELRILPTENFFETLPALRVSGSWRRACKATFFGFQLFRRVADEAALEHACSAAACAEGSKGRVRVAFQ